VPDNHVDRRYSDKLVLIAILLFFLVLRVVSMYVDKGTWECLQMLEGQCIKARLINKQ